LSRVPAPVPSISRESRKWLIGLECRVMAEVPLRGRPYSLCGLLSEFCGVGFQVSSYPGEFAARSLCFASFCMCARLLFCFCAPLRCAQARFCACLLSTAWILLFVVFLLFLFDHVPGSWFVVCIGSMCTFFHLFTFHFVVKTLQALRECCLLGSSC
jgi:hypothetical protein